MIENATDTLGPAAAFLGQGGYLSIAHLHQREFGRDKKTIQYHQGGCGNELQGRRLGMFGIESSGQFAYGVLSLASACLLLPAIFTLLMRYGSRARPPWWECLAAGVVSGLGTLLMLLGAESA